MVEHHPIDRKAGGPPGKLDFINSSRLRQSFRNDAAASESSEKGLVCVTVSGQAGGSAARHEI